MAQVTKVTFLTQPRFTLSFFKDGNWIEEDRPCQVQVWQDRQQEEEPPRQAVTLDCSIQEGQGALCPVSALTNVPGFEEHQLQTWGYLRLSSAGASFLESFGIIDEGCS